MSRTSALVLQVAGYYDPSRMAAKLSETNRAWIEVTELSRPCAISGHEDCCTWVAREKPSRTKEWERQQQLGYMSEDVRGVQGVVSVGKEGT